MAERDVPGAAEAKRLRKPGWKDPRLVAGLLMVAASVAGVVALVSAQDRTVPMYVARDDISLGDVLDHSRLAVVDVRLDGVQSQYLSVEQGVAAGTQANTLIRAGELVPLRGLGLSDGTGRKPVTIDLDQVLPDAVVVGSRVDIWAAERDRGTNAYSKPRQLLAAVEVTGVRGRDSGFGTTEGTVLEILVDDGQLGELLGSIANEARTTVVYNPTGNAS